ncbi:NUDIX domain-containing protein [Ideonella sp.]|jgi:ADP-ribose pyrophosphatase|uniref:NUDIX domain-containing protein n=1 Tax=Ideonella sp. TaxID=1929293 RepID=UPI0037BE4FD4
MSDAHLVETRLSSEQLVQGNFLDVRRDTIALPDGQRATREYVVHPGAVMVVPILDDGRVIVERQFRYPLQQVILEFPAGKLDAGESRHACAMRELAEETGYRARQWARAGVLHPTVAYSTEFIEIWFARDLYLGQRSLDQGEFIELLAMDPDALDAAACQGALTDAKSLIALMWLQKSQSGQWPLTWVSVPDAQQG